MECSKACYGFVSGYSLASLDNIQSAVERTPLGHVKDATESTEGSVEYG